MNFKRTFGECLSSLLELFKINGSKLAKGINLDQSLVYKWLRNERIPSYHSPYIELITNYLTVNMNNLQHAYKITEFLENNCSEPFDSVEIAEEIRKLLYKAQNYSLEKKNSNLKKQSLYLKMNNGANFSITDTIVIKGVKDVFNCSLKLLKNAPKNPGADKTILATLNSNLIAVPNYKELIASWGTAIKHVLNNGWEIILLVSLNDNIKRTLEFVEMLQILMAYEKVQIFYYKKIFDIAVGTELIIVPETGALFCFASSVRNQSDSGFLFQSKDCIEVLKGHFFQLLASAKPLIAEYPPYLYAEFQKRLVEAEEQFGDRFTYNCGSLMNIMPYDLYEKSIKKFLNKNTDILQFSYLYKRRLDAYNMQIKLYKFRDIWFKESFEQIIFERKFENRLYTGYIPEKEDIIVYIKDTIYRLKNYQNYEIAIINRCEDSCKTGWMVKSTSYVLIEGSKNSNTNFAITEENMAAAFHEYFLKIWDDIPYMNKDKDKIIKWLESLLEKLI